MSRAFSAFSLLIVILPSTLYADIHPEHWEKLKKANKNIHHNSDSQIFQLSIVNPDVWASQASVQYLIYGTDNGTKQPYLDLWSIGDNGQLVINWGLKNFDKKVTKKDESLTVTVPVPNESVYHGSSGQSGTAAKYHLTFNGSEDYISFTQLLGGKKSGFSRLFK